MGRSTQPNRRNAVVSRDANNARPRESSPEFINSALATCYAVCWVAPLVAPWTVANNVLPHGWRDVDVSRPPPVNHYATRVLDLAGLASLAVNRSVRHAGSCTRNGRGSKHGPLFGVWLPLWLVSRGNNRRALRCEHATCNQYQENPRRSFMFLRRPRRRRSARPACPESEFRFRSAICLATFSCQSRAGKRIDARAVRTGALGARNASTSAECAIHLHKRMGLCDCDHASPVHRGVVGPRRTMAGRRSEEHTSELQSRGHLVCRLLLEKKNDIQRRH